MVPTYMYSIHVFFSIKIKSYRLAMEKYSSCLIQERERESNAVVTQVTNPSSGSDSVRMS